MGIQRRLENSKLNIIKEIKKHIKKKFDEIIKNLRKFIGAITTKKDFKKVRINNKT